MGLPRSRRDRRGDRSGAAPRRPGGRPAPGAVRERAPYEVALGSTEIWDVRNDTDYDQSFHLHGFFFRVLEVDGVAPAHGTLEDTAEIPRHAGARLLIPFDAEGAWMFHTHVLDQAELGMMSHVEVR